MSGSWILAKASAAEPASSATSPNSDKKSTANARTSEIVFDHEDFRHGENSNIGSLRLTSMGQRDADPTVTGRTGARP